MRPDPGSFRVAMTSVRAEVSRYWKSAALLAAAVAAGVVAAGAEVPAPASLLSAS
jgi:hypothetical protein